MNTVAFKKTLVNFAVKETVLTLALSVLLPFLLHLLPYQSEVPIGARLLPIFYASFIAIILFRPHIGIISAMFAPVLNLLITGFPIRSNLAVLTFELLTFTLIALLLKRRLGSLWFIAPLAYSGAKFISLFLAGYNASFVSFMRVIRLFADSLTVASPGILVLLILNKLLQNYLKSTEK